MREIPLTRGAVAIVDDDDYEKLSKYKWYYIGMGYAARCLCANGKHTALYMHKCIIPAPSGYEVDHINQNKLDNRKENLRACTRTQNLGNRTPYANNTSGYKGVSWNRNERKWIVQIGIYGKRIRVGEFADKKEAAKAYNKAAIEWFGEFACINNVENSQDGRKVNNMTDEKYYSVVDELNSLRSENKMLTAIVEAYRIAGKIAKQTNEPPFCLGDACPVFHECCAVKGVACLHPSDYEAEWLKAGEAK